MNYEEMLTKMALEFIEREVNAIRGSENKYKISGREYKSVLYDMWKIMEDAAYNYEVSHLDMFE